MQYKGTHTNKLQAHIKINYSQILFLYTIKEHTFFFNFKNLTKIYK